MYVLCCGNLFYKIRIKYDLYLSFMTAKPVCWFVNGYINILHASVFIECSDFILPIIDYSFLFIEHVNIVTTRVITHQLI